MWWFWWLWLLWFFQTRVNGGQRVCPQRSLRFNCASCGRTPGSQDSWRPPTPQPSMTKNSSSSRAREILPEAFVDGACRERLRMTSSCLQLHDHRHVDNLVDVDPCTFKNNLVQKLHQWNLWISSRRGATSSMNWI